MGQINLGPLFSAIFRGPPDAVNTLAKGVINTSEFLKILRHKCSPEREMHVKIVAHYISEN
jgi:hypothetical protein